MGGLKIEPPPQTDAAGRVPTPDSFDVEMTACRFRLWVNGQVNVGRLCVDATYPLRYALQYCESIVRWIVGSVHW